MDLNYIAVPGTWGWSLGQTKAWWQEGSPFHRFMVEHGFHQDHAERSFWSTRLDGVSLWQCLRRSQAARRSWAHGGKVLHHFLTEHTEPGKKRRVICHSHGLQVVLYACAQGAQIDRLISLGSPVRKDMRSTAELARPNIVDWTHVASDRSDTTQIFGELFDGAFGIVREHPLADKNIIIPSVGHSQLLRDNATLRRCWPSYGLIRFIAG